MVPLVLFVCVTVHVCVCALSWNGVSSWVLFDTSSQPVSAPRTSFSSLLSVESLRNVVACGSLLVGPHRPVGDCWQSWVFGMQPTRPVGPLLALSVSWFGSARGCLFDGCGSEECNRAPPPSSPHHTLSSTCSTTLLSSSQCSA